MNILIVGATGAAEYLGNAIGQGHPTIQWAAVRPDNLIDEDKVSEYTILPSPSSSPIFNSGKTSRINVAHFMAELIENENTWAQWQGKMPAIYNEQANEVN